ncbi:hypothetical protein [Pseudoalteromonas maricaloris]|uniref:hypothetical protein n=1 Tax=Pseudoalteromonas maricaloris TaxID=184924 RepID=UPI00057DDAE1|nr:hypothetical protein [Pseudoalteromonas flavipulchra]KID34802.1 hypothetical protein QT15_17050 [Pseudoalteromonas flavipulchra NCIMB 2033 = ATCC BAA-314]MBD0781275.1 hypothetical protein [Pseudoalteromonas flavipulchra]MBE0372846.1 hypothetical protein [Pseudoalteromonas flavipulchra NCIMB 2033 = ATCC BAA-314]
MSEEISELDYASYTSRFGPNMFYGLIEIIESNIDNYDSLICHSYPKGNISSTKKEYIDCIIFDTAVCMSYTNLHTFFIEEYYFYIGNDKPRHLGNIISRLVDEHQLEIEGLDEFLKGLELLRRLRNRISHDIGRIDSKLGDFGGSEDFNLKAECDKFFGVRFFKNNSSIFTSEVKNSLKLVRYFANFVIKYCDLVFEKKLAE